jgi:alkaline phosphatase D
VRQKLLLLSLHVLIAIGLSGCAGSLERLQRVSSFDAIAFGSCAFQENDQVIWNAVIESRPDLFVFLGDNIYADTTDIEVMRAKYAKLGANPNYQRLLESTPVVATWDDHDYGQNNAGADYPMKVESREAFLDFFGEPAGSERRTRDGGIYAAYLYGPKNQRVQVILLDTRWDRSSLQRVSEAEAARRRVRNIGPYTGATGPDARMLGEDQWAWLEEQLRQPATLRLIGTSIPFVQQGTGWETWENFPDERQRLLDLIESTGADGVLFITGDTHRAQFSKLAGPAPYPLWELNSSGLTENYPYAAPDKNRLGGFYAEDNYGLILIDWTKPDPDITMEIRNVENELVMQNTIRLSELQQ